MRIISTILFTICLLITPMSYSEALVVAGKVFHEEGFANGAKVYAFKSFAEMGEGSQVAESEPSKDKGDFTIEVPEGSYVFLAKWRNDGRDFFCYQPSNPITAKPDTWITLFCNESHPAVISDIKEPNGRLAGVVFFHGEPLDKAYVSLYPGSAPHLRGPGYLTLSTDAEGRFAVPVNEGSYMVVARKRKSGRSLGPTAKGDLFCYFPGNPVEMHDGIEVSMEVPCMPIKDIKMFVTDWEKFAEEIEFKPEKYDKKYEQALKAREKPARCGIKGVVTDEDGKPVEGLLVLAHTATSDPVFYTSMLHLRTAAGVTVTDENGKYFLGLEEPGLYYITVREKLATSLPEGEYFGQYEEDDFLRIEVKEGEILEGRDITFVRVLETQ